MSPPAGKKLIDPYIFKGPSVQIISCNWYENETDDQWYICVLLNINIKFSKSHVRCDDADEKTNMGWDCMMKLWYDIFCLCYYSVVYVSLCVMYVSRYSIGYT